MKKIVSFLALFFGLATGRAFASCSSSMPYTFTSTSFLSYVTTNANNNFLLSCTTTVDNTQVGSAGFYASQIIPTSVGQATFGGSQTFTFPAAISVGNGASFGSTITTAGISDSGGITSSSNLSGVNGSLSGTLGVTGASTLHGVSATTGSFSSTLGVTGATTLAGALAANGGLSSTTGTFSGTVSNAGSTSTGAVQQTVSATTYTAPYDAQSTAGSTNTHMEHGILTTGSFSANFACTTSHSFTKAFTASPTVVLTLASSSPTFVYPGSVSASAFTACGFQSGGSGTVTINWIAMGE